MQKKEILEIKKQFSLDNLTKIATAYVSPEKELSLFKPKQFLFLPEEESFKYLEIFKGALTGKKGKTLYDVDFPLTNEEESQLFFRLKHNNLEEDDVTAFCKKVAESYAYASGYLIILTRGVYDIPSGTTAENFDASDSVYEYILCCICPVSLSKPGLSLKLSEGEIKERIRDWCIEKATNAFLYPTFNDRTEDIHSLLYYAKNVKDMQENFLKVMVGFDGVIRTEEEERELFREALGDSVTCDSFLNFQSSAAELLAENDEIRIAPDDLEMMLKKCGAEETEEFIEKMEDVISLSSIVDKNKLAIEVSGISLKVPMNQAYRLEIKEINGRSYFCLPVNENHVDINGIPTKIR